MSRPTLCNTEAESATHTHTHSVMTGLMLVRVVGSCKVTQWTVCLHSTSGLGTTGTEVRSSVCVSNAREQVINYCPDSAPSSSCKCVMATMSTWIPLSSFWYSISLKICELLVFVFSFGELHFKKPFKYSTFSIAWEMTISQTLTQTALSTLPAEFWQVISHNLEVIYLWDLTLILFFM